MGGKHCSLLQVEHSSQMDIRLDTYCCNKISQEHLGGKQCTFQQCQCIVHMGKCSCHKDLSNYSQTVHNCNCQNSLCRSSTGEQNQDCTIDRMNQRCTHKFCTLSHIISTRNIRKMCLLDICCSIGYCTKSYCPQFGYNLCIHLVSLLHTSDKDNCTEM